MTKLNSLSPNANSLLLSIFNCCKTEVGGIVGIYNDQTQVTLQSTFEFRSIPISDLVLSAGFMPDEPKNALKTFHDALKELCDEKCILIEGQNWINKTLGRAPLQSFAEAAEKFAKNHGAKIDPNLDTKFYDYIREHYRQLAASKIYITDRGVHWCTDKRHANVSSKPLPPRFGNIA